jgi:GrpE
MQTFSEEEYVVPQNPDRQDEVIRLQAEFSRVQDLYLRALADLDNFRKKVQRDQARMARLGKREILLRILEVLDSLDRAMEQTAGLPESMTEGFHVIRRQLLNILKVEGVTPRRLSDRSLTQHSMKRLPRSVTKGKPLERLSQNSLEDIAGKTSYCARQKFPWRTTVSAGFHWLESSILDFR